MHRRTALAAIGGVATGAVAGCLGAPRGGSSDRTETPSADERSRDESTDGTWPQLGYDARNTRHVPDARGPRDDAELAWTRLGDRPVYPPVVDGDLYLVEAWTDGAAFALSSADGSERWSNADLPPSRWAPALHGDRLLVVAYEDDSVGLYALDAATGDRAWVRDEDITASVGSQPPIAPTVRDGSVYVSSNRGIVACEAATGAVEWTAALGEHLVETDDGPTWRTDWATPAVTADRAFTFDTNDSYRTTREVYAVDRDTGQREWTAELEVGDGWSLEGHAVAGSDRVFVSALDPHVWAGPDDSAWSGTERLFALDAGSGAVAWTWELPRKTLSPPAYADGTLYVGEWYPDADTGRLHALDAADGSRAWTYRTDAGAVLSPTVAGDTVYFNQGDELAAVSTADGTRRWRLAVGARTGPPVVVGDALYVHTEPGHNYDSRVVAVREP